MEVETYRLPIAYFPRMNYAYKNSLDVYNKYRSLTAHFVEEGTEIKEYESVVLHFCKKTAESQFPAELNDIIKPKNEQFAENTSYPNVSSILNEQPKRKGWIFVIVLDISLFDETAELSSGPGLFVFIANSLAKSEGNLTDNCIVTTKDRVGSDICNHLEKIVLKPMNKICAFLQRFRKLFNSFPLGSRKYINLRNVGITKPSAITQQENFQDKSHLTDLDVIYQSFGSNHNETHAMVTLGSRNYYDSRNVPTTKPSATTQNENGSDKSYLTDSDAIYQGFRSNHSEKHAMVALGSRECNDSRNVPITKPSAIPQNENGSDKAHLTDSDAMYQSFRSNHGETHAIVSLGSRECNDSINVPITKPSATPQNENGSDKAHLTDSDAIYQSFGSNHNETHAMVTLGSRNYYDSRNVPTMKPSATTQNENGSDKSYLTDLDAIYQGFRSNHSEKHAMVSLGSRECNDSINVPIPKPSAIPQNENVSDKTHLTDLDAIYQGFRSIHDETHAMVTDTATCNVKNEILHKKRHSATEWQLEESETKKQKSMKKKFSDIRNLHECATDDSHILKQIDAEVVDNLLKSIKVLYGMSNIPENEQPLILDDDSQEFNEDLCSDLFSISKYVKGVGYYYSTLHVLVSEKVAENEPNVREQIENVLKQHNETKYDIVEVSENIHNLMHVGAKLEPVSGYGTLGCFAKMGEDTCIVLSGHVAKNGGDVYFESKRKVCRILKATTKFKDGDLDIAAAEINDEEGICSSDFMDSEGTPMKGKLRDYIENDKVITEEQKVHIWGASSKPGKGFIMMPKYVTQIDNCRQVYIQIKDGDTKFANRGDSGAIVCTDDPDGNYVHVLGMVVAEGVMRKNDQPYYLALPLSDGLKQLGEKTGQKFELC